ncbi:NAD(P)/FAD-dependent oxidoreductase [Saccharothrix sp. S26]|uniref:flavin-dependent monooxygenase QhpG n=1 Tax=Saccharothrix sp. S26 TaxID=2907215 RepID=UPI0022774114|nr:NAD(P)/FAD-dependent oxidoreductase [Saccharothrix sp. S26]
MTTWDVCVVGGGPAGSACALRLARLGHRVVLLERRPFPRPHVGEALSPGVRPLLDVLGLPHALGGSLPSRGTLVRWEDTATRLVPPDPRAVTVDRGWFDHALLAAARAAGVSVRQPARAGRPRRGPAGWEVPLRHDVLRARFLVDASGRHRISGGTATATGPRTLALHTAWPGGGPARIGTGPQAWCWGAPLPDGAFRAMAFVDPDLLRRHAFDVARLYHHLLDTTGLFADRPRVLDVAVCDATAYRDDDPVTEDHVKVGEAAFTLDPLTSSGVDSALHSAMAAAVTVHTVLSDGDRAAALAFYRDSRDRTASRHATWTAAHYDRHQRYRDQPFWRRRAAPPPAPPRPLTPADPHRPVRLADEAAVVPTPCPVGDLVTLRRALTHPSLPAPVAHVADTELAPLLDHLDRPRPIADLLHAWSAHLPAHQAEATARWLLSRGLLVTA